MFRLFGQISIYGSKASIDKCALIASIPNGIIKQIGLKRKVPEVDSWIYKSPWYRFHPYEMMDDEIRDFLAAHAQVGDALAVRDAGIEYAFLTLCPVAESYEDTIAGIFSRETLKLLVEMGLELEIAPAAAMPAAPYWCSEKTGRKPGHNTINED